MINAGVAAAFEAKAIFDVALRPREQFWIAVGILRLGWGDWELRHGKLGLNGEDDDHGDYPKNRPDYSE